MVNSERLIYENGGRYFKASRADHGTKVAIIKNNRDKYSVSAMCDVLQIARSTFYYEAKERDAEDDVTEAVVDIILKNVNVQNRWHYICVLVDLFNREIIGHSAGPNKDAALITRAFATIKGDLRQIQWFHTDRGSEFKNQKMDELLETIEIGRSLSMKGCPYDNAVAEATYKMMKTEFVNQMTFQSLSHLELELSDYVNWFNNHRIHGTLDYKTPVQYRKEALKIVV